MPDLKILSGVGPRYGIFRLDYDVVWNRVREDVEVCPYGDKHRVGIYTSAIIFKTDRTWQRDYYGPITEEIWEDECGCEVRRYSPVDFYGGTYWVDPEGKHWEHPRGLARDISGSPLTDKTPGL